MNPLLQQFKDDIANLECSSKSSNIVTYLDSLKQIISLKTTLHNNKNFTEAYKHILSEYVELREFYININKCSISQDLSLIKISHLDESDRQYELEITVDLNKPQEIFKVSRHSLPETKDGDLFQNSSSLKTIYEKFVNVIERLQCFFDSMDSLDNTCHILDPERPSRKDCYRRIGLGKQCYTISLEILFPSPEIIHNLLM